MHDELGLGKPQVRVAELERLDALELAVRSQKVRGQILYAGPCLFQIALVLLELREMLVEQPQGHVELGLEPLDGSPAGREDRAGYEERQHNTCSTPNHDRSLRRFDDSRLTV